MHIRDFGKARAEGPTIVLKIEKLTGVSIMRTLATQMLTAEVTKRLDLIQYTGLGEATEKQGCSLEHGIASDGDFWRI